MKNLLITLIFSLFFVSVYAQSDTTRFKREKLSLKYVTSTDYKNQFASSNLATLWTHTENKFVYGFIGENFQRLRIKFIRVVKDSLLPDIYHVYGKSLVRNNLTDFTGVIKISTIRKYKITDHGVDDEYKKIGIKGEYILVGKYILSEDKNKSHSGTFSGVFATCFYLDIKNQIKYDDIEIEADGFSNNEFVGNWTEYGSTIAKKSNWGDYRIPYSNKFDIGAGEFSPIDDYYKFGWENFQFLHKNDKTGDKARGNEEAQWWK